MNAYLYSPDVVRVTLVMGVIVSMLFYERLHLTTGGAIVPAYLALGLQAPLTVTLTVLAGFATHLIVEKVITRQRILYGRRKFEVEVLVGLTLVGAVFLVRLGLTQLTPWDLTVSTIGFLVPGIIAHDMTRQGPDRTVMAIAATTAILATFLYVYVMVLPLAGADVAPPQLLSPILGYDRRLILIAVAASVLIGMVTFAKVGIRSGGFITAAYVAFMLPRWWDVAYLVGVTFLTWLIVVKLIMPRLMLFGRRKLSVMVLFGALIGWTVELVARYVTDGLWEPARGLTVMTVMLPALIANDVHRQGWERTAWGVSIGTFGVYGAVNLVAAVLLGTGLMGPVVPGCEQGCDQPAAVVRLRTPRDGSGVLALRRGRPHRLGRRSRSRDHRLEEARMALSHPTPARTVSRRRWPAGRSACCSASSSPTRCTAASGCCATAWACPTTGCPARPSTPGRCPTPHCSPPSPLPQAIGLWLVLRDHPRAALGSALLGAALVGWIVVQLLVLRRFSSCNR
ncbi:MAG: poly-gamma-glutamate biosynthesis protein PgsC/CapC [Nocardioides sp.]